MHGLVWGLVREQPVLLRPIERQIEFGQTRRRERHGLAGLQDRFDELWAQKCEIDQTADERRLMPSRLANSFSDRARPLASSSNHARPRAIALMSAGSWLAL